MGNRIECYYEGKKYDCNKCNILLSIFNVHIAMKAYLIKKLLYQIYIIYNSGIEI